MALNLVCTFMSISSWISNFLNWSNIPYSTGICHSASVLVSSLGVYSCHDVITTTAGATHIELQSRPWGLFSRVGAACVLTNKAVCWSFKLCDTNSAFYKMLPLKEQFVISLVSFILCKLTHCEELWSTCVINIPKSAFKKWIATVASSCKSTEVDWRLLFIYTIYMIKFMVVSLDITVWETHHCTYTFSDECILTACRHTVGV